MNDSIPRITVTLDEETYNKVKDFQFENRMNTQTQAVIKLINLGLVSIGKLDEVKERRSKKERLLLEKYNAAQPQMQKIAESILSIRVDDAEERDIRAQIDAQTKKGPDA